MEAATDTTNTETPDPEAKPERTRTSITIRTDYLARAKEAGPNVSAVIDKALEAYLGKGGFTSG